MDESRFLIVGAYGQLGKALQAKYPKAVAVDRDTFDMTDWGMIQGYDWSKFDVILNAAAYTNVDGAETAEGRPLAWKINATGPGYLSRIATEHELTLVHISSEYVFDGTKNPKSTVTWRCSPRASSVCRRLPQINLLSDAFIAADFPPA